MIKRNWLEPTPIQIPDALREQIGGHDVVLQRLARHGFSDADRAQRFLDAASYIPAPPDDLPDMDRAVERVRRAIRQRETILVWGDFDVDGQTSTALLVSALRDLGANVHYHIPNRFREGHGIHVPTLKTLLDGGVDLLLTCDTGIAAHDAVSYANSRGVDVVITDHHSLSDTLPAAVAAVNPMRLPAGHALRELPGVGTAYQLVRALYGAQSSDHLLDLVAVGIVADVMVLVDDTRFWLQRGLEVLRQAPRPGLRAILERAEIDPADLNESHIGFALAPRLNALGRLADANPAVELLTTSDHSLIVERVNELEGLNQQRRFLTRQVYEAARQKIEADDSLLKYAALVVAGEGWHGGVVGIVASRLAEDYGAPVILLSEQDGSIQGSARSVAGCNLIEAIRTQAHLLHHFGGHSMAAGLSMPAENLFEFRRGLSSVVRAMRGQAEVVPHLQLDAELSLAEIDLAFADELARLAPYGNGNPPLTFFTRNVQIKNRRTLGSKRDHLQVTIADAAGNERRVMWWFGDVNALPDGAFDLAYTVRSNVFNGKREAMIEWLDARPAQGVAPEISGGKPAYEVIDYRLHADPRRMLAEVRERYPAALIYSEGDRMVGSGGRYALQPAETLIVWTVPPDPLVWDAILNVTQPQRLILFGVSAGLDDVQSLVKTVAGLAKHALSHKEGVLSLAEFAALTGQREQTVRLCLKWLEAKTELRFQALGDDLFVVATGGATGTLPEAVRLRLETLLTETQAYRAFWNRSSVVV
jgi:single-stranded-DNA-specific exonuclease